MSGNTIPLTKCHIPGDWLVSKSVVWTSSVTASTGLCVLIKYPFMVMCSWHVAWYPCVWCVVHQTFWHLWTVQVKPVINAAVSCHFDIEPSRLSICLVSMFVLFYYPFLRTVWACIFSFFCFPTLLISQKGQNSCTSFMQDFAVRPICSLNICIIALKYTRLWVVHDKCK
jgi:hypothetical protein